MFLLSQRILLTIIFLISSLFCSVSTFSQKLHSRYTLVHYTHESGLDQESISQIRIGTDGLLWLINNSGVLRFDGRQFKYISLPQRNRMITFYENLKGDSLYAMDSENIYYTIRQSLIKDTPLLNNRPYLKGTRRNIMFLTPDEQKHTREIYKSFEDKNNGIFIGKDRSMYLHQLYTDTIYGVYRNQLNKTILKNPSIGFRFLLRDTMYFLDAEGNWAAFFQGKLLKKNYPSGKLLNGILPHIKSGKLKESMHGEYIYSNNKSAYFFFDKKLYEIISSKGIIDIKILCDDLPDIKDISGIEYHTQANTYFISSFTQGLYSMQVSPFQILKSNLNILYQNNIMGIMPMKDGSIITTRNVYYSKNQKASIGPFPDIMVHGIAKDAKQNLYVSFQEKNDYILKRYTPSSGKNEKIANGIHISLTYSQYDTEGNLWLSDFNSIYKIENNLLIKKLSVPVTKSQEFSIYSFCLFSPRSCYIGMTKYLLHWDIKTNKMDTMLRNVFVRSLVKDTAGHLWIGTYGMGYYVYKPEEKKLTKLPTDRNGGMDYVHNFSEDSLGFMWSGTNNGLFRYRKNDVYHFIRDSTSQIYYTRFDVTSGLSTNEFNGGASPSSIRDATGYLLLASMNGIVRFKPESVKPTDNSFPVYVESITADDSAYSDFSSLHFPSGTKILKFIITSSLIGIGKNNWYQYQLEGNSIKWENIQENGEIVLNGLKSGQFKLIVRKETNQGFSYLYIPFTLDTPFYLRTPFILLVVIILLLSSYLYYKFRLASLENKKIELEHLVDEKTGHLNQAIQELKSSNNIIEKATSIVLHDLRTPLKFISSISSKLSKNVTVTQNPELASNVSILYMSSSQVFQFSNNLLSWLVNNKKGDKTELSNVDLCHVIEEITEIYSIISAASENQFRTKTVKNLVCWSNAALVAIIVRNVLDNANKYTHRGIIELVIERASTCLKIKVTDTGCGFDVEILKKRLQPGNIEYSSSLGIHIIHDICQKIEAIYHFESDPGKGTVFTLDIPLQKK